MVGAQHDLSIISYAVLAGFAIGQELLGLQAMLVAGCAAAAAWVLISLGIALAMHWRGARDCPPQTGGAKAASVR